ncbi:MAG: hypothetical protein Q3X10_08790 [Collinsella sp.]|nr:hypothetical protein [Collinsella sp.]
MRKALATIAIAAAVSLPVAIIYAALKTLQLLALGLLFLCALAVMA